MSDFIGVVKLYLRDRSQDGMVSEIEKLESKLSQSVERESKLKSFLTDNIIHGTCIHIDDRNAARQCLKQITEQKGNDEN